MGNRFPFANPFASLKHLNFPNIVLAFAGNHQLAAKASILSGKEAGKLLSKEEIREGRRNLFSGYTGYKQLLWLAFPSLVLLHFLVVVVVTRACKVAILPC